MKKIITLFIIVIIIIAVLFLPVKFPYSLKTVGRVMPCREWIISGGLDGLLKVTFHDNSQGKIDSYFVTEAERADVLTFNLHHSIIPGAQVSQGDTVGWIDSNEINLQLVKLHDELNIQKATLAHAQAGEKESVIEEARKLVLHAREQLVEQEKIVNRLKDLTDNYFISYQEYEIALSTQKLYSLNVEMAESQLQSVQTGVKPEEIEMITSQIVSIENEISFLSEKTDSFTLISPLSGIVLTTSSVDTLVNLVNIGDTSSCISLIPLKLKNRNYVKINQNIEFTLEGSSEPIQGRIFHISNVVQLLNGEQILMAKALLEGDIQDIISGGMLRGSIICEPLTLREHCLRALNTMF